jgi:hypothetical protein
LESARDKTPAPNPAIGVVSSPGLASAPLHAPHHHVVQGPRSIQAVLARHNRAETSQTCATWQCSPLQSKAPLRRSRPLPILRAFTGGICRGLIRWIGRRTLRSVRLLRPAGCTSPPRGAAPLAQSGAGCSQADESASVPYYASRELRAAVPRPRTPGDIRCSVPYYAAAKVLARPSTSIEPNPETHRFYQKHVERADRILQSVKAVSDS